MMSNDKYTVLGYYLVCYLRRDALMSDKLLHGTASYRDYSKLRYILGKTGARKLKTLVAVHEFRIFSMLHVGVRFRTKFILIDILY